LHRSTLAKRAWLLLIIAAALSYGYGLGRAPLVGADEPRYAEVAREMYVRGDAVTPTLGGHTWFEKPALPYWLAMASYGLFGVSEQSARLGACCAGLLTLLLLGVLAGTVEQQADESLRGYRLVATATAATSAGLMVFARALNFDIFITAATTGALVCFLLAELKEEKRAARLALAGFYSLMGVGLLAKGLLGIVLPCGVIGCYYLLRRSWPPFLTTLLWGLPLMCAVAAVWYAPVIARHGRTFINEFFIQHHFARYVSNKYHHPQPFYFYPPVLALMALPWTAFLVAALVRARKWHWRGDAATDRLRVYAFAWVVVPVAFFSLSGSKLPGYILPALPGAALLAGARLTQYFNGGDGIRAMRATGVLLLLFVAGLLGYELRAWPISLLCTLLVAAAPLAAGLCAVLRPQARQWCAWGVVAAAFAVVVIIAACALGPATRRDSVRDLFRQADARGYASAPVYGLHTIERTAEFYAAGRLAYDQQGEPVMYDWVGYVMQAARTHDGPVLVIVPDEYVWQLTGYSSLICDVVGSNGRVALVAARAR
jgi:4-amino-4-deoxy-L-arabinose transferase-like glycosyltransferase